MKQSWYGLIARCSVPVLKDGPKKFLLCHPLDNQSCSKELIFSLFQNAASPSQVINLS